MNYAQFIQNLGSLSSTEEVLVTLFNYFKDNVSYNYDELQVVKYRQNKSKELYVIHDLVDSGNYEKTPEFKEKLIKLLDVAFLKLEGRPLTERNKKEWFRDYGKVIHFDAQPARNGLFKIPAREAYDIVRGMLPYDYQPVYENGMLRDGVCTHYAMWVKQICDERGIPCLRVIGRGTTGHDWNLVYLKDKGEWRNFDMTMVRFYLDDWTKEYGEPEKWIMATNEEMFKMQPQRLIRKIYGDNNEILLDSVISADNQQELDEVLQGLHYGGRLKR